MNKSNIVTFLKLLYRILPLVISAIAGGTAVAVTSGCKCGSVVSFVSPAI